MRRGGTPVRPRRAAPARSSQSPPPAAATARQQLVRELAPDGGADLRHLLHRRRADRDAPSARRAAWLGRPAAATGRSDVAGPPLAAADPPSSTALVSSSMNSGTPSVRSTICSSTSRGSGLPPATRSISSAPSRRLETVERIASSRAPGRSRGAGTRAGRSRSAARQVRNASTMQLQQLQRGRIDPVRVLEDHQHWPPSRQAFELPAAAPPTSLLLAAAG